MVINKSVEIYRIESKVRLRVLLCATGTGKDHNYLLTWEMGARLESQPILPLWAQPIFWGRSALLVQLTLEKREQRMV